MLSQMMDDIAAIIDIETQQIRQEPVNLAELLHELLLDCQAAAERARLKLATHIESNLSPLLGDPDHLKRVIHHLLNNALKFTAAGGKIVVNLTQKGRDLILEVSDDGVGIPDDQLERIFERFYQIDGSATRRYGGIGLGLALVKEIVEAHGGQVHVESQPGSGSTFRVALPSA
jgi:signal transduction histidine kinase